MDIHIYHHYDNEVLQKLDSLLTTLEVIMSALDDLKAQVAQTTSVEQSAVTLINGIASQIQAAVAAAQAGDAGALTQLASDLKASQDALAAAVTANTPAAPAPAPAPGPTP